MGRGSAGVRERDVITPEEKSFFLEQGYLVVPEVVTGDHLARLQSAAEQVWAADGPPCNQHKLLKHPAFLELIEHPPIPARHQAIFGRQVQLLQYDLLRQEPNSTFPTRSWHRDFSFPGDTPLSINTILFLDAITDEKGPTRVIPGSHRGLDLPPYNPRITDPLPDELSVPVPAGTAIFINSAIWHSGARNEGEGLRRGLYLYYGYWWLKRYEADRELPWQALDSASEQRLRLLGVKMPDRDLHIYEVGG